jgi:hypothetical protein
LVSVWLSVAVVVDDPEVLTVGVDVVEKEATLGVASADDDADSVGETDAL